MTKNKPTAGVVPFGDVRSRLILRVVEWLKRPINRNTTRDPVHQVFESFTARVNALQEAQLLELGSRARSGNIYKARFGNAAYTGVDILPGENVDVVGDAHELSRLVPRKAFDAAYSISVFEHLAMPWQVVLELNAVLKTGGLLFISTHPTWPAHERPWDFWRYSTDTFPVLLNPLTGFEIVECVEGLPCLIVPRGTEASMIGMWRCPAHLGVAVIARKIGAPDPRLSWSVTARDVLETMYP